MLAANPFLRAETFPAACASYRHSLVRWEKRSRTQLLLLTARNGAEPTRAGAGAGWECWMWGEPGEPPVAQPPERTPR